MAFVLTEASAVTCTSQGRVATAGQPKLKVAGAAVVRPDGITGKAIDSCLLKDATGPPTVVQCKTAVSASGAATKLKVAGGAVALDSLSGTASGSTSGKPEKLSAAANQSKLKAM